MAQDPGVKYEVRHQIGRGSFGSAFLVTNKQDKEDYVLKRVRLAKQTKWQRNSTLQERDLATSLRHPFIVPCIESWVVQNHTVNMIYAFCQNGDLASYLARVRKQEAQIDEGIMQKWLCQLLLALDYLQTQHVLHRDIKTSNLMLTCDDDVQLGDFGLATLMEEHGDESRPLDTNLVGTPHFMSPEALSCKPYGYKADVWSLGCVFYELTAQRPTFNAFNIHGLVSKIKKNKLTPLPNSYSSDWRDTIELMLCKNPDRRPSVQQLMALPALRPAMLEARTRARELIPTVPLPPLLDPTPLTPLPLLGQYRMSGCHDTAVDSECSAGSMSDQHGGSAGGGSDGGISSRISCRAGDRRSAPGLAAAQAIQASELSELWKANFSQVQQEEQLDTERPEQQCAADAELAALQQQQEVQQCQATCGVHLSPGRLYPAGGHSSCSNSAATTGCCSPAGNSSSSPCTQGARDGRGLGTGYSPRNASNVIDGYKRLMTPRPAAVHQPGIKRTPSERVAAAIAAAGCGQHAAVKATGRVTPDLCPRPLAGAGQLPSKAPRYSSSSKRSTPGGLTPQQQTGSADGSSQLSTPASGSPRVPSSIAKERPAAIGAGSLPPTGDSTRGSRRQPSCDGNLPRTAGPSMPKPHQPALTYAGRQRPAAAEALVAAAPAEAAVLGAAATAAAAMPGASVRARTPPRPLSAPRSCSSRRTSQDRDSQLSGGGAKQQQQQQQRPPWGSGGGSRSCITPGKQRPEQSPILKAGKAQNGPGVAAPAAAAAAGSSGEPPGGGAEAGAAENRRHRRSHGQLSPMPSQQVSGGGVGCPATSSECASQHGAPEQQQDQQPFRASDGLAAQPEVGSAPLAGDAQAAVGVGPKAAVLAALSDAAATPPHGQQRRASYACPASTQEQQQQQVGSELPSRGSSAQHRRSAPGMAGLPRLPLYKLQRGNMPAEQEPLPMASPVHGKDGPAASGRSWTSSTAKQLQCCNEGGSPFSQSTGMPHAADSYQQQLASTSTHQERAALSAMTPEERTQQAWAALAAVCSSISSRARSSPRQWDKGPSACNAEPSGSSSSRAGGTSTSRQRSSSQGGAQRNNSTSRVVSTTDQKPQLQQQPMHNACPAAEAGAGTAASSRDSCEAAYTEQELQQQQQQQQHAQEQQHVQEQQQQHAQEQQQQQQWELSPQLGQPNQLQLQRLELLEAAMMVIGGLVERRRWTELSCVLRSPGLLQYGLYPGLAAGAAAASEQQQAHVSHMLKLGDIVVLGSSRSIRGEIRYIGPVAWDLSAADWVGMELDRPCGVDSTQRGLTYFDCQPDCASFHRAADLTTLGS